jgi:hypothetical protein
MSRKMENMMNVTHSSQDTHKPQRTVIYWHANQLAVTHHSLLNITEGKERIIESLDLDSLNNKLQELRSLHLESFTSQDVPHPYVSDDDDYDERHRRHKDDDGESRRRYAQEASFSKRSSLQSSIGKYFFPHSSDKGTIVVSFFHLRGDASSSHSDDRTPEIVKLINEDLVQFNPSEQSRLLAASPNWLNGGTGGPDPNHVIIGCPASPPIPASDPCTSGNWHITLPAELPETLLNATGDGVQVFVLDTLPPSQQISDAVIASGNSNPLLVDIAENVKQNYQILSDVLDVPSPDQPATGNDINGNLVGFPMNDHGLFIAGIIRDLAPAANIECIRVLNDYAVGDTSMLLDAFSYIQDRLINLETGEPGNLYNTPVVINMSLTATLPEEALAQWDFTDMTITPTRLLLLLPMQALARNGVVFTASSGNGSGPRDKVTNPQGERLQPRYPAAFAYPLPGIDNDPGLAAMIPVGAINKEGLASSYSNYPGELGIGAYGGELPQPVAPPPDPTTGTQPQLPIDAIRGVYTAPFYPALSETDSLPDHSPEPLAYPLYQSLPATTWAYWMGTSFATPIISALAARVLENQPSVGDSVRQTLLAAAPSQVDWTNLDTGQSDAYGPMIMVNQECHF